MVAGQKRKAGILMKSAYNKEIWRAIRKGKKRFFSIMLITILGVGMLTGLRAACMDLRYSADQFYDRQGLYDISVVSTLGLTEKDVDALKALDGVADAVGVYSETVHAKVNDHEVSIAVCTLNDRGINQPYVLSGRLPESADETAVTTAFADETGCGIGDVIAVDTTDDEESSLLCSRFTVTGIVVDVQDVNNAKERRRSAPGSRRMTLCSSCRRRQTAIFTHKSALPSMVLQNCSAIPMPMRKRSHR